LVLNENVPSKRGPKGSGACEKGIRDVR